MGRSQTAPFLGSQSGIPMGRLVASLRSAKRDVTYHLSPDANHVLKHEPLSPEQLRADMAAVQTGSSAEGRALDQDVVTALVAWLRAH